MNRVRVGVGADIESVGRFRCLDRVTHRRFLERVFTHAELAYCFAKSDPAPHLAARWCAKEAVVKAVSRFGIAPVPYCDIAITRSVSGAPGARIRGQNRLDLHLSVSHSSTHASAFVIAYVGRSERTPHRVPRELHRAPDR